MDLYDTLTRKENDTLRKMILAGSAEAHKLADFAVGFADLWESVFGVMEDLSAVHEELCRPSARLGRFGPSYWIAS